jgi:RHS repeat-associated protein
MGSVMRDYYPFGLTFNSYTSGTENLYKFGTKEEQKEWSVYDFDARMYDPALGRFLHVDPLADKAPDWTPYRYGFNNPLKFIDPTGMFEDWYANADGEMVYDENIKSQADLDAAGIEGQYQGEDGWSINEQSGDWTHYKADGTTEDVTQTLEAVEISPNHIQEAVYKAQEDFVVGSVELTAEIAGKTGTGISLVGYGAAFVPGAQPVATGLIATGNTLSSVSSGLTAGVNFYKGENTKGFLNLGNVVLSSFLGKRVSMAQTKGLSTQGSNILNGGINFKSDVAGFMINYEKKQ